ncbi:MAG: hypothetical protein JXA09_00075 [Anaerolineae bacterium]|nr:hypothetical protein [Anaerolineae bacterium]
MSTQRKPWWRLDARQVLGILLLLALFAMSAREIADPDFWWHLATGRYIVETRSIPRHDVFSYTATDYTWITHEWLTQVAMIGLYRLGGLTALLLATCAAITLTFGLVYAQCDARPHLAVFAVLLGALASAVTWGARPQMLNALMAAWFMHLLYRYRAGDRRALWLLPLSTALWVNLHSGYFLGLALIALFIAGEGAAHLLGQGGARLAPRQMACLALSLLACVCAALLNPNGYRILRYPFETLGSGAMQRYIQEWAPPDYRQPAFWPAIALLYGGAVAMAYSKRRRDLTDVLFYYGLGFAGLLSARHLPLFAVVAVPILTRYLAQIEVGRLSWDLSDLVPVRPPVRGMVALNWILVVVALVACAGWVSIVAADNLDVEARRYPLEALAYIDAQGLGDQRMYNSYNWGGYLLWRGYRVFIDGRADVYLDAFMDEYVLAYQLAGDWRRPLDRYDVDYVLIEAGIPLATLLEESVEWMRVYVDAQAVIYMRAEELGHTCIRK